MRKVGSVQITNQRSRVYNLSIKGVPAFDTEIGVSHNTMKPIRLVSEAIKNSSMPGDLVLDPFLGSGSTMIAAEQTGRICYGMELDPKYADVIRKRWWKYMNDDKEDGWEEATKAIITK